MPQLHNSYAFTLRQVGPTLQFHMDLQGYLNSTLPPVSKASGIEKDDI
jgi:hypothetical protein